MLSVVIRFSICDLNIFSAFNPKSALQGNMRRVDMKLQSDVGYDVQKQRTIITAVLRLVFALTSLVETSEFFEVSCVSLDDFSL